MKIIKKLIAAIRARNLMKDAIIGTKRANDIFAKNNNGCVTGLGIGKRRNKTVWGRTPYEAVNIECARRITADFDKPNYWVSAVPVHTYYM